ncbi:SRPBCC family protein [Actinomadura harenae]|uniref:Cyclase n=1 Tax=Actinomadura harenae TaxID=2483351 RepID=A0A3M2LSM8_9ACTN|nr:SRPBCC family protein [Actinomadura harenae]RMI40484.1 cyclase [Actinomadura harenae]
MADRTSSSITIKAAKADVMAVIADLDAYPEWAGGVRFEVTETGDDGRARGARMSLEGGPISDTVGLAYTWDGDDGVRWELVEPGTMVSGLRGAYTLSGTGPGETEVTYELAVDVRIPMIGMIKRKGEKRIIDSALKGLKRHVER